MPVNNNIKYQTLAMTLNALDKSKIKNMKCTNKNTVLKQQIYENKIKVYMTIYKYVCV